MNIKPKIIVLPHWRTGGGSGFYTQDIISGLESVANVSVGGVYAKLYNGKSINDKFLNIIGRLSFPVYEGVRLHATIWHVFLSILRLVGLYIGKLIKTNSNVLDEPDIIVLTSSIQCLAIPFIRKKLKKCSIVIAIQEIVCLNRSLGKLVYYNLCMADHVISISQYWYKHAKNFGLPITLLRNGYDQNYRFFSEEPKPNYFSDVLYLGGGSRIKGFDTFLQVLPFLVDKSGLSVTCLGDYDEAARCKLQFASSRIKNYHLLNIIGLVNDIRPYLMRTSLLILPIEVPHFCRPAIEAGIFDKTFIITRLKGLNEFACDKSNCIVFEKGNIDDLYEKILLLLDDHNFRRFLERNNNIQSSLYIRNENQIALLFQDIFPTVFNKNN